MTTTSPTRNVGRSVRHGLTLAVAAIAVAAAPLLLLTHPADAAIVPPVGLGTSSNYSVLAATTVTNTNASVLAGSVGLSPGSSIVGFPPGIVLPPAVIESTSAVTIQAQVDLTTAYNDAAGRMVEFTLANADLTGQTLTPGVYAGSSKAPLGLTGQLTLDGQNNPNAVFIFQTDSTLITGSGSSILLVNGASECNVFWQVGSSATLGTGSIFIGNVLAQTSITVASGVVVHGRALARTGAVTLDNDTFTQPSCTPSAAATTTTAPATTISSTTVPESVVAAATTVPFSPTAITLPATGAATTGTTTLLAAALLASGALVIVYTRRRPRNARPID